MALMTENRRRETILAAGSQVEVLCTLTDRWVPGFEAVAVGSIGCRVRRQYDGRVIPDVVSFDRVRAV